MTVIFSQEAQERLTAEQGIATLIRHRQDLSDRVTRMNGEIRRHQANITAITATLCALQLCRSNHR